MNVSTLQPIAQSAPSWTVPELADCDPGIRPIGYQVLIRMSSVPEKSAGGILFTQQQQDREGWGSTVGRIVALSPFAFTYARTRPREEGDVTWPEGGKPQVGDVVHTGKSPGDEIIGRDGEMYRLVHDREIKAVVEWKS